MQARSRAVKLSRFSDAQLLGKPLPLSLVFAFVLSAVTLLHMTLLRLPYFWDEGGYYIPAAWDFFRHGTFIPETTIRNAHPPVPSILLAGWWRLFGFHVLSTRLFICIVSSTALVGVFRMARLLAGQAAAFTVLVLTAVYPVWFAQSTLAHADIFAAAFSLWGLSFYVDRKGWIASPAAFHIRRNAACTALLFSLAALSKETAIVLPASLFCYELWLVVRQRTHRSRFLGSHPRAFLVATAFPVLPLAGWYLYHRLKTGFTFGNPEYLRYNATANLSVHRVLLSLWFRFIHLTAQMNLFVPVLLSLAVLLLPRRAAPAISRVASGALLTVLLAHWVAFSVLGGALLTRYLLVAYPILLLFCVVLWRARTAWWPALAALSLLAFAIGCQVNPPFPFAPEDNLAYRDMVVLHQAAIRVLQQRYPGATVLTAWPAAAELQRPELGYVAVPFKTTEIENFTAEQVRKAAEEPGTFDAALVFSTKYVPPAGGLNLSLTHSAGERFFDAHRDLLPQEVARALGGRVVWQAQRKGQWIAILRFDRGYDV